jgi:uncharacterized protein (DUF1778 family)
MQANKSGRKEPASKPYRFDARLNENQKLLIQRAADLEGRTLTGFVLHSAESAAERTIQERTMLLLNARDSNAFVKALLAPAPEPGPALRNAAKRYKKRLGFK